MDISSENLKFSRKCPLCGKEMFYTNKYNLNYAEKRGSNCKNE